MIEKIFETLPNRSQHLMKLQISSPRIAPAVFSQGTRTITCPKRGSPTVAHAFGPAIDNKWGLLKHGETVGKLHKNDVSQIHTFCKNKISGKKNALQNASRTMAYRKHEKFYASSILLRCCFHFILRLQNVVLSGKASGETNLSLQNASPVFQVSSIFLELLVASL